MHKTRNGQISECGLQRSGGADLQIAVHNVVAVEVSDGLEHLSEQTASAILRVAFAEAHDLVKQIAARNAAERRGEEGDDALSRC